MAKYWQISLQSGHTADDAEGTSVTRFAKGDRLAYIQNKC